MRMPGRRVAMGLVGVLLAGASGLGGAGAPSTVLAGEPAVVELSIPEPDDGGGTTLSTVDTPPALPEVLEVDPIIDAANAATDTLLPEDWEVEALAASLGDDPAAAFSLVRDGIRFDAYAGVLRGAEGALAARAGNSWDRALLLAALLTASGHTTRIAVGALSADVASAVVERALLAPSAPLAGAEGYGLGAAIAGAVRTRATRDLALLEAVGVVGASAADDRAAAEADVRRHAWVQVDQDGAWLDLDPTLPDATPGTTLTTAATILDVIPDAERASVVVRLLAESLVNDVPETTVALEERLDAATAADQQVLLTFGPSSGGGGGLLGGVGAPDVVIPALSIGGDVTLGQDLLISASVGGGLLGGFTDTDLVRLVLEVESRPGGGGDRITARQVLLDRAPADQRASGAVSQADLLPPDGGVELPLQLRGVRHLLISTGGVSPRATNLLRGWAAYTAALDANDPKAALASSVPSAYWTAGVADRELVVGSELDIIAGVDDDAVRAYVAVPRVSVITTGVDPAAPDRIVSTTDLLIDEVRVLSAPTAAPDAAARHRAWYGVLQSALETELSLGAASSLDPDGLRVTSASLDVVRAPLTVFGAASSTDLPAGAPASMHAALEAGRSVVVAGDAAGAQAWWDVSTLGSVRAVLAPSYGGVGRVGGPRPPGVPRVQPPSRLPNQLPNAPQQPPKPPPPRAPARPPSGPPRCTGNEQTIIRRCVAFFTQLTMTQLVIGVVYGVVVVGVLTVVGIVFAGG